MSYRKRKDISSHGDILNVLLTFVEVYHYIFYRSIQNPKIIITAYDCGKKKFFNFVIDTKYSHNIKQTIINEYCAIITKNDFFKNIDSVSEIVLTAKGVRAYKEQTIYANPDAPYTI